MMKNGEFLSTKKPITALAKWAVSSAHKPVVLFVTCVEPNPTQEIVEDLANSQFQNTAIQCEKLKTRHNFYASFKVTLQGVQME